MSDFGSKLLSSFVMSAFYSFLKCLSNTQTSSGENKRPWFGSPKRDPFFDPRDACSGFDLYFENHWVRSTYQTLC